MLSLVISLFTTPNCSAKVPSSVPKHKAVKLYSNMHCRAVGLELNAKESTMYATNADF